MAEFILMEKESTHLGRTSQVGAFDAQNKSTPLSCAVSRRFQHIFNQNSIPFGRIV